MTAEEKERISSSLNKKIDDNESKDGFGLKNVHQRVVYIMERIMERIMEKK